MGALYDAFIIDTRLDLPEDASPDHSKQRIENPHPPMNPDSLGHIFATAAEADLED